MDFFFVISQRSYLDFYYLTIFSSFYFQSLVKAFENRTKDEDPGQRLPVIFPGCLLNFCNETPQAVETLAKFKCASSVLKNILNTKTNDAVFNSSILFIHAMVECETGVRFFFLLTNLFIFKTKLRSSLSKCFNKN